MTGRWRWEFGATIDDAGRRGPGRWGEVTLFTGLNDWRFGLMWERHPGEWQAQLQLPGIALNLLVVGDGPWW